LGLGAPLAVSIRGGFHHLPYQRIVVADRVAKHICVGCLDVWDGAHDDHWLSLFRCVIRASVAREIERSVRAG